MKTHHLIAIVAVLGISLGLGYSLYQRQAEPQPDTSAPVASQTSEPLERLPAFSYPDLQGNLRSSQEWSDKIVVLNFWATWCPPCTKEMPLFIEIQEKYADQVQFVGIAIDEADPVRDFADTYGINFPTLLGDMAAIEVSRQLGNRFSGLPFTAIFDRSGNIRMRKTGELKREELESQLQALL